MTGPVGLDVQALIGEVARRHNVRLDPDDPILVTVTLNERILAGYLERVAALVEEAQDQTAVAAAGQMEAAREVAARLVTGAAAHVAGRIRDAGDAMAEGLAERVARDAAAARAAAHEARSARRVAVSAALAAGAAAGLAAGLVLGGLFG